MSSTVEHAEAIVRTIGYHGTYFCAPVISFSLSRGESSWFRKALSTPFKRVPSGDSGYMDRLSPELLNRVLVQLNIQSLFRLRQTNRGLRVMVDALTEYQAVITYGLDLFCVLLRSGHAIHILLSDFYDLLCTRNCAFCGEFGGFLFIPDWTRCCCKCVEEAPALDCVSLATNFGDPLKTIMEAKMDQLIPFKTFPGAYGLNAGGPDDDDMSHSLISITQLMLVIPNATELCTQIRSPFFTGSRGWMYRFMASCGLPHYDRRTKKVEYGLCCLGCQLVIEKGFFKSEMDFMTHEDLNKVYDEERLLDHFERCEQAQLLWNTSEEGTIDPPE